MKKLNQSSNQRIDLSVALRLFYKHNHTYQEIGDYFGVTKQSVQQALKKIIEQMGDPVLNRAFAERKVEALTAAERLLYAALTDPKKIEAASINNIAFALKQVHDMNRLEKGLATSSVDFTMLAGSVKMRRDRIKQINKELGLSEGIIEVEVVKEAV
ncbi:MAG: hypothetical protein KAR40_09620 [Candidatus Sabulitectum sp.]|nr:hypothetical protein [Candidatus Sabulitectum sp.]